RPPPPTPFPTRRSSDLASEDLASFREDFVESITEIGRAVRPLGSDLEDVLLPALQDLLPEVLPEGSRRQAPLPAVLMVGDDVGDQGARDALRPLIRVLGTEDRRRTRRGARPGR